MAQRAYEAMVILDPNKDEEELASATQRISDQIGVRGGQVEKVDSWGRRRMLYPVKHSRDGFYVIYNFRSEPQSVAQLEAAWRIQEDVLRTSSSARAHRLTRERRLTARRRSAQSSATK